jgi:hypothetical protein
VNRLNKASPVKSPPELGGRFARIVERVGDLMAVKGTALVAKRTFRFRNNARSTGRIVAQRKFLEDQVAETAELDMGIWFAGIGLSKKGKMDDTDVLRKICTISNQAHGKAFELLARISHSYPASLAD